MSFAWIFECEDDGYDGNWLDPDEKVALSKEDETLSWDEEDETLSWDEEDETLSWDEEDELDAIGK